MNESKVFVHRAYDLYPSTPVVTHADYKALEDECESLRARVGELVEADAEVNAANNADDLLKRNRPDGGNHDPRWEAYDLACDESRARFRAAHERFRKAMEAFK